MSQSKKVKIHWSCHEVCLDGRVVAHGCKVLLAWLVHSSINRTHTHIYTHKIHFSLINWATLAANDKRACIIAS